MADDLGEQSRTRTVLAALAAMVAVALVLGAVVSLVALGAARVVGVGDPGAAASSEPATLHIPAYRPTRSAAQAVPVPSPSRRPKGSAPRSPSAEERQPGFTLRAGPVRVSPGERINLTGDYAGRGAELRVQRKEGGTWTDFAGVTARVTGGSYQTWVQTSRTGRMRFRMLSPTGRPSNVVTVTVG